MSFGLFESIETLPRKEPCDLPLLTSLREHREARCLLFSQSFYTILFLTAKKPFTRGKCGSSCWSCGQLFVHPCRQYSGEPKNGRFLASTWNKERTQSGWTITPYCDPIRRIHVGFNWELSVSFNNLQVLQIRHRIIGQELPSMTGVSEGGFLWVCAIIVVTTPASFHCLRTVQSTLTLTYVDNWTFMFACKPRLFTRGFSAWESTLKNPWAGEHPMKWGTFGQRHYPFSQMPTSTQNPKYK